MSARRLRRQRLGRRRRRRRRIRASAGSAGVAQARSRGVNKTLPARYRSVSFDSPPVSDMARDRAVAGGRLRHPRLHRTQLDEQPRPTAGASGSRATSEPARRRSRCSSRSCAIEAGTPSAIYSLPRLLARIRRTYDADPGRVLPRLLRPPHLGRPPPHRRPRRREAERVGSRAALLDRRRALRQRSGRWS